MIYLDRIALQYRCADQEYARRAKAHGEYNKLIKARLDACEKYARCMESLGLFNQMTIGAERAYKTACEKAEAFRKEKGL